MFTGSDAQGRRPGGRGRAVWAGRLGGGALVLVGLLALPARAADTIVAAGETLSLDADVELTGGDTFTAGVAGGARCTIHGNGFGLLADKNAGWTGTIIIRNCDIDGMGTDNIEAFLLTVAGSGKVIVEGSTFSKSGRIEMNISEHVDVVFRNVTILEDAVVPEITALADSPPVFWSTGATDGMKLFQGNNVFKGRIKFTSTKGWQIGGSMPGEGNVLAGLRTGIELENASDMAVIGNYSHTTVPRMRWNQVKNLSIAAGDGNTIEHNVFWGHNWLVEMNGGGELRYNLLINAEERGWVLTWTDAGAKIHHNIGVATRENIDSPTGGIVLENAKSGGTPSTEVYNNTLDLGGTCAPGVGAAVMLKDVSFLVSLRSNVFTGIRVPAGMGAALVAAADPMQPLDHLGYADYNLFYTPDSPVKVVYGAKVAGKTARADAGFGLNDLPAGGGVDAQVDPVFAGRVPRTFPFDEATIKKRETTTCQILAYYRSVYAPGTGSPLIDAGDPSEKEGNDVGAVGAGADNVGDLFGRLCDDKDVGTPKATDDVFKCPPVPVAPPPGGNGGGGGGGEGGIVEKPHGITCVCDVGAARAAPGAEALGLLVALGALASRRRRAHGAR